MAISIQHDTARTKVAYFSMEIALEATLPTYSGGLGVLAGDTLRAAADLNVGMIGVTLAHRKGYLAQHFENGQQVASPAPWTPETRLREAAARVRVEIEGRTVTVRAFRYDIQGASGISIPVFLLDTDLPENTPEDRSLTDHLYGGDDRYRLCQEVVLGIGGVRILRALGFASLERFHMNEGHAALLALELLDEHARAAGRVRLDETDVNAVRKLCVFTTHTPVPAGHDKFPLDLARAVIGRPEIYQMHEVFCCEGILNMTYLALNLSHYVNGVAKRHGEISQLMFSRHRIDAITNGVHVATWAAESFRELFDRYLPDWRRDNFALRYALNIPSRAIWDAHLGAKRALFDRIRETTGSDFNPDCFTIGFGRRATAYKRPGLLLRDPERLKRIAEDAGRVQIVFAGKAHPKDEVGKQEIARILAATSELRGNLSAVYLEDYGIELAQLMVSGVDLWLNTPRRPLEASGTSGMKAGVNAVPSLSVLDGWWLEGHVEGVTGWAIGERGSSDAEDGQCDARDAESLYAKLGQVIVPMFYARPDAYVDVMKHTLALTASFFNTHRMLQQYITHAYMG